DGELAVGLEVESELDRGRRCGTVRDATGGPVVDDDPAAVGGGPGEVPPGEREVGAAAGARALLVDDAGGAVAEDVPDEHLHGAAVAAGPDVGDDSRIDGECARGEA